MPDLADALAAYDKHPRLTSRQRTFDELLTRYVDATSTVNHGALADGAAGEGRCRCLEPTCKQCRGGMPPVWNWTYRELEKLLRLYRRYAAARHDLGLSIHNDYWHLAEWYLRCRRYPQWPKKRMVQRGRELVEFQPPVRMIVERLGDPRIVYAGLVWLDNEWSLSVSPRHGGGEPDRPDEFDPQVSEGVAAA